MQEKTCIEVRHVWPVALTLEYQRRFSLLRSRVIVKSDGGMLGYGVRSKVQ